MFHHIKRPKIFFLISIVIAIMLIKYGIDTWRFIHFSKLITIPTFTEQKIDYAHRYTNKDTWPTMGGAIFDAEGDGVPEIFITGADGQPDFIFSYRDGAIIDITEKIGLSSISGASYDAHTLDVDNDQDDDLIIIQDKKIFLYVNSEGTYKKSIIPLNIEEKATPINISSGDIDNDGFPDLYVSTFIKKPLFKKGTFNDIEHTTANFVLHNNQDYTFSDITKSSGLDFKQNTFYSRFVKIDDDELIDLVVIPNTDRVRVYKNLGGLKFQEMNPLTDYGFWMGVAISDIDGDGDMDIFLSNAGKSIPRFILTGDATNDQPIDVGWRLLRNDGEFIFTDITIDAGIDLDEWAWGSESADFNNDGRQDIVVLENFIDWPIHKVFANPGRLLIQDSRGRFIATERWSGVSNKFFGHMPLVVDINNDGFTDLLYLNINGPVRLFLNNGE